MTASRNLRWVKFGCLPKDFKYPLPLLYKAVQPPMARTHAIVKDILPMPNNPNFTILTADRLIDAKGRLACR